MMAHPLALSSVRIDGKKGEQKRKTFTPAPGVVYTKHNHNRNEGGALHLHDLACLIGAINVSVRICEHVVLLQFSILQPDKHASTHNSNK